MRGLKEQKCLDSVKHSIFARNGNFILHPYTGKTYSEVSDEEFVKEQIYFINSDCYKNFFGLLKEDRQEIEQILRIAKPNENTSVFPDFVFINGYIEHFQVSSSKTTRKGAKHIKEMNQFISKVNEEADELKKIWNEIPSFNKVRSKHWAMSNSEHKYSFFFKSFKNNWQNHINSLDKYAGNKEIGIFMIEYPEVALTMLENVYADWIDGMSNGDMREQEKFNCYRLTRDKNLLEFIYQYKKQIKYVIFVYCIGFEIIRLENIPYLLKLLPWKYDICPMMAQNISSLYNISVLGKLKEKEETENE